MAATNPSQYYADDTLHGNYQYIELKELVNNFMQLYTGDNTIIGIVKRYLVLTWAKKGLQQLTYDVLREFKAVELELGDTLDVTMPQDYLNYVRISWLDTVTGEFRPMAQNTKINQVHAYLQDNDANILFDENGYVLEGSSYTDLINDNLTRRTLSKACCNCGGYYDGCCSNRTLWSLDTSKNYNGQFTIDKRLGKIHFSSDVTSKVIILEYISDGLQYESESDIKVHKFAEMALYSWINYNLLLSRIGVPQYEKLAAKRKWDTDLRNAKVKLGNLNVAEVNQYLKGRNRWFKG